MKRRNFVLLCALSLTALAGCSKKVKEHAHEPSVTAQGASPLPSASAGIYKDPKRSPEACTKCKEQERAFCSTPERQCGSLTGAAEAGPAKGKEKSKLCEEALACASRTGCADSHESFCFCGEAGCLEKGADGPCMKELQAAFETTDTTTVGARYSDRKYAGGKAMAYFACLNHRCKVACDY